MINKISTDKLRTFENHPFKVTDNEEMDKLVESIKVQGILSPIIVRPIENSDEYEVISGHRRLHAAKKAGIDEVPVLIYELDHNAAVIAVVDSNLHRENLLPSEKAFAYKMKMEALKHQGKRTDLSAEETSRTVCGKLSTAAEIGKELNDSERTVQKYIRLTYLIPDLLQKVDERKIALSPAVELSYLTPEEQGMVFDAMELNDNTPSHAQSIRMKKLSQKEELFVDTIYQIIEEEKPNQQEHISFKVSELKNMFPKNYTTKDIQEEIMRLIFEYDWKRQAQEQKQLKAQKKARDYEER